MVVCFHDGWCSSHQQVFILPALEMLMKWQIATFRTHLCIFPSNVFVFIPIYYSCVVCVRCVDKWRCVWCFRVVFFSFVSLDFQESILWVFNSQYFPVSQRPCNNNTRGCDKYPNRLLSAGNIYAPFICCPSPQEMSVIQHHVDECVWCKKLSLQQGSVETKTYSNDTFYHFYVTELQ